MDRIIKRVLFSLACILVVLTAKQAVYAEQIAINASNFPDEAIRNSLEQQCLVDENNEPITNEQGDCLIDTADITYLYCFPEEKITSLKGIELFSNLEKVYLFRLDMKDIDLSANAKLNSVYLDGDSIETVELADCSLIDYFCVASRQLDFDYSELVNVTNLSIYSDKVEDIDLSIFPNLTILNLGCANIKEIDLSKSVNLYNFAAYGVKSLEKITVGTNDNLEFFSIEGASKLTNVDVSKCKNLTYISIVDCKLSKIDTSKNKKLSTLEVNGNKKIKAIDISKNKKLENLNIGMTSVSKLDTSKNKNLLKLLVYNTKVSTLNLKKNKNLYLLSYEGTKIKSLPLSDLYDVLTIKYKYLKPGQSIDLSKFIGKGYTLDMDYTSEWIKYNRNTGKISFKSNATEKYGWAKLRKGDKEFYISFETFTLE